MSLTGYTRSRERYISTGQDRHRNRMIRLVTPAVAAQLSALERIAARQRREAAEKLAAERYQASVHQARRRWIMVCHAVIIASVVVSTVSLGIIIALLSRGQQLSQQAQQQMTSRQMQAYDQYQQQVAQAVSQMDAAAQPLPLQRQGWLTYSSTGSDWQTIHVRGYQLVPNPTGWSVIVVLPWSGSPYTTAGWAYSFSATLPGKNS